MPTFDELRERSQDQTAVLEAVSPNYWMFWCPGCDEPHAVTSPPWTITGTPQKPTIRASVLVHGRDAGGYRCHSFVTDGQIRFLGDCDHSLAGQTVALKPLSEW